MFVTYDVPFDPLSDVQVILGTGGRIVIDVVHTVSAGMTILATNHN